MHKIRLKLSLLILTLFVFDITIIHSQEINTVDTLNFKYGFKPGMTLIYGVISTDSIIFDIKNVISKERHEIIQLRCDSIGQNAHFYMSQTLVEYESRESDNNNKEISNKYSPWLNRSTYFEIDSTGKRYSFKNDKETIPALAPGGAFQQPLIFELGKAKAAVNKSWTVERLEDIPENGVPTSLVRYHSLLKALESKDTLNHKCQVLEFVKTSQGSIDLNPKDQIVKLTSKFETYGRMFIDKDEMYPVHFFVSQDQKLTVHKKDGSYSDGKHFINNFYTLMEIIQPNK